MKKPLDKRRHLWYTLCMETRRNGESDHDWGQRLGWEDVYVPDWQLFRYYSPEFRNAYTTARNKMNLMIDEICQSRCFQ